MQISLAVRMDTMNGSAGSVMNTYSVFACVWISMPRINRMLMFAC